MQDRVDELYDHFVDLVSRNRGMDDKAIRATKARTFTASKALSNGLADISGAPEDALANFLADLSSNDGDTNMSTANSGGTVDQAAHDAAVAQARAEGHAAGMTEGAAAAQARIQAIMSSPEAKERPALAHKIAFTQAQSAEDAISFMVDLPKETAASAPAAPVAAAPASAHANQHFAEAMNAAGGANVSPGTEATQNAAPDKDDAAPVLAAASQFGIAGLRSTETARKR